MQADPLSRARRITAPEAAAAFADPLRRRIVLSCVGKERSVAELATALAIEIKRLHYHVTTLARLRLLTIAHSRRRAGRPVKLYRASAPAFFVPAEIAAELPSAALYRQMEEALGAARRAQDEGVLYDVSESGQPRMRVVALSSRAGFTVAEAWRILTLATEDARRLSNEIHTLLEKYQGRSGEPWLMHFACARQPRSHPRRFRAVLKK